MDLSKMTEEQLAEKLCSLFEGSLAKRDAALIENVTKAIEDKRVAREAAEAEEKRKNALHSVPGLDLESKEVKNYSISRLLRGAMAARTSGRGEIAMKEICPVEYALHIAAKDQAGSTDSAGGYLVPAQVMQAQLIPLLQEQLALTTLGVTTMGGLTGSPVEIPKRTGGATGYWTNHDVTSGAAAPTLTDQTFGQLRLTKKTVMARAHISNDLIAMSQPAAEQVIREQLLFDLALTMEIAAYNGSGVSGQPLGILQTSGVNTISWSGVAASASGAYDKLADMVIELRKDNALRGSLAWVMDPTIYAGFLKSKDPTDGSQPKERRMLSDSPFTTLLGYKYLVTNNIPANTLMFGNWADMIVGNWGGLVLKVDDLSVLGLLQTQVLAALNCDIQVRHPESFCLATSIT